MRTIQSLFILLLLNMQLAHGQVSQTTLRAVFLYQSIKYLEWPADDLDNFEILVVGSSEMYEELQKIAKVRKVGNKSIVVKHSENLSEVPRCQMVVFSDAEHAKIVSLLKMEQPILLVTNTEGMLEQGSDLNFVKRGDKLSYQINTSALHKKKIKVSSSFSAMAEKVM